MILNNKTVYTIGHSTRPIDEFIDILQKYNIDLVIDVRTIPKSLYVPQYNMMNLKNSLNKAGIKYYHFGSLGGLRHGYADSVNKGWHNASFRGYADYMQTTKFKYAIAVLIKMIHKHNAVIMCAEAVPWRCHRSLIGDALIIRGIEVLDIFSTTNYKPHKLTSFAVVHGKNITYP